MTKKAPRITPKRLERAMLVKAVVEERYPLAFVRDGEAPRPLKLGIDEDLKPLREEHEEITFKAIRVYLELYCAAPAYIEALRAPKAKRIDLQGNEVGAVSDSHQQWAIAKPRTPRWALDEPLA